MRLLSDWPPVPYFPIPVDRVQQDMLQDCLLAPSHISKTIAPTTYLGPHFPDRIDDRPRFSVMLWWQSRRFVLLL